jgi:hypothetical protein
MCPDTMGTATRVQDVLPQVSISNDICMNVLFRVKDVQPVYMVENF